MKLRRFLAPDARSALERIRKELGPEAVVVTSRKTPDGVEFMAGHYGDLEEIPSVATGNDSGSNAVWRELTRLRSLLQNQLAGFAWSAEKRRHPVRVHAMQRILAAGFSPKLARHLAAALPKSYSPEQADAWLRLVMIRNLRVHEPADLPGIRPGVWALVGPTGHGKTTTLAKLAANAALRHGQDSVALVSMDGYRIGAQQQLETYARMMGVTFAAVDDADELPQILEEIRRDKACVLIDSAGFATQDERFGNQLSVLKEANAACLLTLSASTQGSLAESIIQRIPIQNLEGIILTKLDEGGLCGPLLDCLMRYRLSLCCLATGQRVPEDLHAAQAGYLVDRALRARDAGGFAMKEEDWAIYSGLEASIDAEHDSMRRSG